MAQYIAIPTVLLDGSERVARTLGYFPTDNTLVAGSFSGLIDTAEIHTLTYQVKTSVVVNPVGLALFSWGMNQIGFPSDSLSIGTTLLQFLIDSSVTPNPQETTDKKIDIVGVYLGRKYHIRGYVDTSIGVGLIGLLADGLASLGASISYVSIQVYKDHNSAPISVDWKTSICSFWSDTDKGFIQFWHEPDADVSAFMTANLSKLKTPLGTTPTAFQLV